MSMPTTAAAVDPAQEMAMQPLLLSCHAPRPMFDDRSPPPPPYWRVPRAAPFFHPNFYGGGGGGGYFSQLNRATMLPSPPPPPPPPTPPYSYALGRRLPPPAPFAPHFGLPAPSPMFDHHHRIPPVDPPVGANFAAPFQPLDPFGAPFNPETSGSVIVFDEGNEIITHAELLKRLCNQVEYYFSDENLVSDWYLKSRMDSEGWVSLEEIAAFHKVRHLTKNLLDVFQVLREALSTSLCVEIQEDKVRKSVAVRNPPPNQAIPAPGR